MTVEGAHASLSMLISLQERNGFLDPAVALKCRFALSSLIAAASRCASFKNDGPILPHDDVETYDECGSTVNVRKINENFADLAERVARLAALVDDKREGDG